MRKFLVMSILLATFVIPLSLAARAQNPRKLLRLVQKRFIVFCFVYVVTILYIVPRL